MTKRTEFARISLVCVFCRERHNVRAKRTEIDAWQENPELLIQNTMPSLSPTEREQLVSRICPDCQINVFGE